MLPSKSFRMQVLIKQKKKSLTHGNSIHLTREEDALKGTVSQIPQTNAWCSSLSPPMPFPLTFHTMSLLILHGVLQPSS